VRRSAEFQDDCDDYGEISASSRFARRSSLRAAIFGRAEGESEDASDRVDVWAPRPLRDRAVVTGQVLDVSPHLIILRTSTGEQRLTLTPDTKAWRGQTLPPAAIRHGDHVIVRKSRRNASSAANARNAPRRPELAERVWAQIGRVTGIIIEKKGAQLLVDEGPAKGRKIVIIGDGSLRQILVRFPRMEPGYLIDVIGLRQQGYLLALTPATAQPPYRADHPPSPPLVNGHVPERISGTVVWHEPGEEPDDLLGVAYPALDPETNCEHTSQQYHQHQHEPHVVDPHTVGPGCVRLPYLSVGSAVRIHNECSDSTDVLPVTSCGAAARLFCDRCVKCGTSPRGRVADLTISAFAELGGNLEDGCFNATLAMAG
jgi:hypothetical protein